MEPFAAKRDTDHFEIVAFTRQAEFQRRSGCRNRFFAGVIDRDRAAAGLVDIFVIVVVGLGNFAQPFGDRAVIVRNTVAGAGNRGNMARQTGSDRAHGNRQRIALIGLDNPERSGKFYQRRRGAEMHGQRKALALVQRRIARGAIGRLPTIGPDV